MSRARLRSLLRWQIWLAENEPGWPCGETGRAEEPLYTDRERFACLSEYKDVKTLPTAHLLLALFGHESPRSACRLWLTSVSSEASAYTCKLTVAEGANLHEAVPRDLCSRVGDHEGALGAFAGDRQ